MNTSWTLSRARHLTLLGLLCLWLALFCAMPARAQCGPIPTANALTAGSGGSLSLPGDFIVNGLSTSGTGPNLPTTGIRNNNASTFPSLVPASFPSFSSSTSASSGPLAAGTYSTVSAVDGFSTSGGTYYIVNFNVASSSTITLGAGTYYLYNWSVGSNVTVILSGAVKIYMGNYLSVGNSFLFNTAGPTANGLIELGPSASAGFGNYNTFRGVIYGTGTNSVIMGNNAVLTGLIAIKGSLSFSGGSSITLSAADQAAIGGLSTCDATSVGLVADYHFDECSYNGSSGEARDSRGSYHATSSGAKPSTAAGGVVGRYFNSNALNSYLTTTSKVPLAGSYTIATWYLTPFAIDNTNNIHSLAALDPVSGSCIGDFMYTRDNDAYRWRVYTNANGPVIGSQVLNLASGWHHIALVGSGSSTQLYLDGSYRETLGLRINSASSSYGLRYIGSSCDSLNLQAFRAPLDEFMVFSTALGASDISAIYNYQRAGKNWDGTTRNLNSCVPAIASFLITGTGTASTCSPQAITVTAKDSGGNTITGYTGTVTLRTSSGMGTWALGSPAPGGGFSAGSNDGQATYTFVSGDAGVARFTLSHAAARDLTVLVTDTSTGANTNSATVQFRDNAFVWTEDLNAKISGSWIGVAGRPHDMKLTLVKKDAITGACGPATDYTGSRNLKLWRTDSGGPWTAPSVVSPALSIPTAKPAASNLTLNFSTGAATFNLGTSDVGQYTFSVADETGTYATNAISGSSSLMTVRPFAIVISGIKMGSTDNPARYGSSDPVFGAAGANFSATVAAYRWSAGADSGSDGIPDSGATFSTMTAGGVAPGFAHVVTLQATGGSGPVRLGTLNNGSVAVTGGTKTVTNLQYTEVGGFDFVTSNVVTGYLGLNMQGYFFNASGAQDTKVGRFIPASFAISNGAVSHRSTAACTPASAFSYLGENFQLSFNLSALNALGAITQNYQGDYAKLSLTAPASLSPAGIAGSTSFKTGGGRLSAISVSGRWENGVARDAGTSTPAGPVTLVLNAARATGAGGASSPDGPFNASFGLLPSDGEVSGVNLPDLDTDYPANGAERGLVATVALRYGRLRLQNAIGSQHRPLSVPLQAQYWDGSVYQINTQDSCTRISSSQISFGNYRKTMTSSDATVLASPITVNQGKALITLAKPAAGRSGSYDLALALGSTATDASCLSWSPAPAPAASSGANLSHLRWPWCGTAADKDPSARASFGLYTGTDSIIYQREN